MLQVEHLSIKGSIRPRDEMAARNHSTMESQQPHRSSLEKKSDRPEMAARNHSTMESQQPHRNNPENKSARAEVGVP